MAFFMADMSVYASNSADVVLSGAEVIAKPGETVELPIVIEENSGFSTLYLYFTYADELNFISITNAVDALVNTNGVANLWDGAEDYTGTGNLAVLKFTVPTTAAYGTTYPITINFIEAYDTNFNDVSVSLNAGSIWVGCLYGDINGEHIDANGEWESDEVNHFHTCGCGIVLDSAKHSGGTATCKEKAKCSTCGQEFGTVDANNHAGGTTIVDKVEANHTTQTDGYTGNTKCLGCNEIIAYGEIIPAEAHTPVTDWSTDETYHWKICSVLDCGVMMEGSKGPHNYSYTLSLEPTMDETGTLTGVCDTCTNTTTITLPELNNVDYTYSEIDAPSYTENGTGRYTWNTTAYGSFNFDVTLDKLLDENAPKLVVSSAKGVAGDTVTVTVKLENNPGFTGLNVYLTHSDALILKEASNLVSALTFTNDATMVWDGASDYNDDGELLKLDFTISEEAESGEHFVKVNFIEAYTAELEEVTFATTDGCVKVIDFIYGDANGDNEINTKDIILIRRHVAAKNPVTGESTVEAKAGADANGDGVINTKDIILVRRYVAAKNPITGESSVVLGPNT